MSTTIITVPTDFELEPIASYEPTISTLNFSFSPNANPTQRRRITLPKSAKPLMRLKPGEIVRLFPVNHDTSELFGCLSRPVLVLNTVNAKYTLVAPVITSTRRTALYLPFIFNGCPYSLSVPNLRIVHNSRILAAQHLGEITPSTLARLHSRLRVLLSPDFTPCKKSNLDV